MSAPSILPKRFQVVSNRYVRACVIIAPPKFRHSLLFCCPSIEFVLLYCAAGFRKSRTPVMGRTAVVAAILFGFRWGIERGSGLRKGEGARFDGFGLQNGASRFVYEWMT